MIFRALVLLLLAGAAVSGAPQRIVSINLVADTLLLDLVPPGRIAALSHLATDPRVSLITERAAGFASTRGQAEEILRLHPDLVVGARWGQGRTLQLLTRLGIPTHEVPLAASYAEIEAMIRDLARAVGEEARGAELTASMHRLRQSARARATARPLTAVWSANGELSGGLTELDREILADAGLVPALDGPVTLEDLVFRRPGVLVDIRYVPGRPTLAALRSRHPAFAASGIRTLTVDSALVLNATHLSPLASLSLLQQMEGRAP